MRYDSRPIMQTVTRNGQRYLHMRRPRWKSLLKLYIAILDVLQIPKNLHIRDGQVNSQTRPVLEDLVASAMMKLRNSMKFRRYFRVFLRWHQDVCYRCFFRSGSGNVFLQCLKTALYSSQARVESRITDWLAWIFEQINQSSTYLSARLDCTL